MSDPLEKAGETDRRGFLKSCGKFALTVPPAMTVLLSTSMSSDAIARSHGGGRRYYKKRGYYKKYKEIRHKWHRKNGVEE